MVPFIEASAVLDLIPLKLHLNLIFQLNYS
jgi:hypothetical protein